MPTNLTPEQLAERCDEATRNAIKELVAENSRLEDEVERLKDGMDEFGICVECFCICDYELEDRMCRECSALHSGREP